MTKPSHPKPTVIAAHMRQVARLLDDKGEQAERMATVLAARGYPAVTLGDYGRPSDSTSSTERAALTPAGDYTDVDETLARLMRLMWHTSSRLENLVERVMAHASDDDPVPAGTGECLCCGLFCRPTDKHPERRLKAGLCPGDYQAWVRDGRPNRTDWIRYRRQLNEAS